MPPSVMVLNYIGLSGYPVTLLVMADGSTESHLFHPERNRIQFIVDGYRDD